MQNRLVVSNSSPLMNLAIIDQLELVHRLFGTVLVPDEVWDELTVAGRGKPGTAAIMQTDWIEVVSVEDRNLFALLNKDLDAGEAAAIALSVERKANLILLDETDARNVAEVYKLPKTGVIGILTRAKRQHLIEEVKPLLDNLRIQAHFRIHQRLYNTVLAGMGELS